VLIVLLLATAATEVTFRLLLGLGDPVLVAPDAACGYITKPNQRIFRFFVHTRINRFGMRSEEISRGRPPGVVRVLFVGDSITYGTTHVDQSKIFTELVDKGLPAILHSPVQVLNVSASAWAPDNEWSWVRSRGIFESNLVLLVLNDGDLAQPRATIDQVAELPQKRPLSAIGEVWSRFVMPRILHVAPRTDAGDAAVPSAITERENLEDLYRFRSLVADQHGRMALVFVPFRRDIPTPSSSAETVLRNWADQNEVPFLDVTSALSRYSVDQICIYDHTHLNALGNQVVGDEILRQWPELGGS
jgi:hypothetical protein